MFVTFDASEATLGVEESGHAPTFAHRAVTPALHASRDALGDTERGFNGVRRRQRLACKRSVLPCLARAVGCGGAFLPRQRSPRDGTVN